MSSTRVLFSGWLKKKQGFSKKQKYYMLLSNGQIRESDTAKGKDAKLVFDLSRGDEVKISLDKNKEPCVIEFSNGVKSETRRLYREPKDTLPTLKEWKAACGKYFERQANGENDFPPPPTGEQRSQTAYAPYENDEAGGPPPAATYYEGASNTQYNSGIEPQDTVVRQATYEPEYDERPLMAEPFSTEPTFSSDPNYTTNEPEPEYPQEYRREEYADQPEDQPRSTFQYTASSSSESRSSRNKSFYSYFGVEDGYGRTVLLGIVLVALLLTSGDLLAAISELVNLFYLAYNFADAGFSFIFWFLIYFSVGLMGILAYWYTQNPDKRDQLRTPGFRRAFGLEFFGRVV